MKCAQAMHVLTLMQLMFYKCNSYWVKWRHEGNDFIQYGIIPPPSIHVELKMSRDRSINWLLQKKSNGQSDCMIEAYKVNGRHSNIHFTCFCILYSESLGLYTVWSLHG
jgi:hypothetical protein